MDSAIVLDITLLSLRVSLCATLGVMPLAIGLGWWLANGNVVGRPLWNTFVMLPMFLPPVATGLILLYALSASGPLGWLWQAFGSNGLLLTWQAEVVAAGVIGAPFFIRSCQQAFAEVPWRLEAMGRTFGLSSRGVFWRITLPLAMRGVGYGFALCFARGVGEFGATSLVAGIIPGKTETLALGIYSRIISAQDQEAWILCGVSAVVVSVIVFGAEAILRPRSSVR